MGQLVVRDVEDAVKAKLRLLAARHGRSLAEKVRVILREAVGEPAAARFGLGTAIAAGFKDIGLEEGEHIPAFRGADRNATSVTRNTGHFNDLPIAVIDTWIA